MSFETKNKPKLIAVPSAAGKAGAVEAAGMTFLEAEANIESAGMKKRRVRGRQRPVTLDAELERVVLDRADGESFSGTVRRMLRWASRNMPRDGR